MWAPGCLATVLLILSTGVTALPVLVLLSTYPTERVTEIRLMARMWPDRKFFFFFLKISNIEIKKKTTKKPIPLPLRFLRNVKF